MERVWDYPRPPAVLPCDARVRVKLGGETLADSTRALRVLEMSHPHHLDHERGPRCDVQGVPSLGRSDAGQH